MIDYTLMIDNKLISGTLHSIQEARLFYKTHKRAYQNYCLQFHANNEIILQIIKK